MTFLFTGMPEEPATPQFNASFFGSPDLRIIALCEVAEVPGITKSANIWVVPDEDAVATCVEINQCGWCTR